MSILQLIEKFEAAVRADEFKGGGDPADIPWREAEFAEAKRELIAAVGVEGRVFTLAEVRSRTTWPRGTRFTQVQ